MQATSTIEPPDSPAPGALPEPVRVRDEAVAAHERLTATLTETPSGTIKPASRPARRHLASMVLAKLVSVLRGDKYMANAYPPARQSAGDGIGRHDAELGAGVGAAVASESDTTGRGAPTASQTKER
jgi:hypothetical protein